MKLCPLVFKGKCYGDLSSLCGFLVPGVPSVRVCFFPFSVPVASLPSVDSPEGLPTFFSVAYSVQLAVESVLPIFGLFSGLFALMWVLSGCICGLR